MRGEPGFDEFDRFPGLHSNRNGGLASLMIYIFPITWGMTDNAVIYNTPLLLVVPLAFIGGFISLQVKRSSKIAELLIIVAVLMSLAGLLSSILS